MCPDPNLPEADLETEPVERRTSPRGRVQGMTVTVIESGPAAGRTFGVEEAGPVSLFLHADVSAPFVMGRRYRVRIAYRGRSMECFTDCVRTEAAPRAGVVLQLQEAELDAHAFLVELLEPATVPPGPV
jgi:hypothetical protein